MLFSLNFAFMKGDSIVCLKEIKKQLFLITAWDWVAKHI
jgi:hypothetical protein